jgi:hypothetical protein
MSNKLMESENCRKAVRFFEHWEYKSLLGSLLRFKTPTVGAFAERLLETGLQMESNEIIQAALSAGVMTDRVFWFNGRYYTPLQYASEHCGLHLIRILLDAGVDANTLPADKRGRTALQAVAGNGYLELCQILLNVRADVNALLVNPGKKTAF